MSGSPPPPRTRNWADLGPRLASAAVLIVATATALVLGGVVFAVFVGIMFAGVYREWETMVTRKPLTPASWAMIAMVGLAAPAFVVFGMAGAVASLGIAAAVALVSGREELGWRLFGIGLFGLITIAVVLLRGTDDLGIWAGVYLGTVVWMTDSAAFFTGRQIGGEKLAPDISPSKTWSGALGGLALGAIFGTVVWGFLTDSPLWIGAILSICISLLAQAGDLAESAVKRRFRIKDSGDIIPGHGGLMDRLDSLTLSVVFVVLVGLLHRGPEAVAAGLLVW